VNSAYVKILSLLKTENNSKKEEEEGLVAQTM
jgi:hypothetical protein